MGGQIAGIAMLAKSLQTAPSTGSPLTALADDLVRAVDGAQFQLRTITKGLMPVEPVKEGASLQDSRSA